MGDFWQNCKDLIEDHVEKFKFNSHLFRNHYFLNIETRNDEVETG
jgi:hypothetical protein